jgi:hypothetical protein
MILTQDVVNKYLNGWRTYHTIEELFPGNMITFLYPHPVNRGKDFSEGKILENFNFTRSSFLKFLILLQKEEPRVFESFLHSTRNSSVFKYTMLHEKLEAGDARQKPKLSDGKEIINIDCNHSVLYQCYSDTDRCMLCDLERI